MKEKLDTLLIKQRADYLNRIGDLIEQPHLKTRYRSDARCMQEECRIIPEQTSQACPKCLLQSYETKLNYSIQPEKHCHFTRKYKNKQNWTKYQTLHAKRIPKLSQHLVIKCSTCSKIVKLPLNRPKKVPVADSSSVIVISDTPIKSTKSRKNQKSKFAGIAQSAVEEAQQQQQNKAAVTKDYISLEVTPLSKGKRKRDTNIPVEQPSTKIQKVQLNENQVNQSKKKSIGLAEMKQRAKDVEDARKALAPLTTKKEKKKLKNKLKKLQSTIRNVEHLQNRPKTSLQDFLSTLST